MILIIFVPQHVPTFVALKLVSQISSIIVALLFVYTINFKSFVTFSYFVNQSEIIELFCINKEKPQLQCDGKCHLATQLSEVEKDTEDLPFSPTSLAYELEINLTITKEKVDFAPNTNTLKKGLYFASKSNICSGYTSITSPPPKG